MAKKERGNLSWLTKDHILQHSIKIPLFICLIHPGPGLRISFPPNNCEVNVIERIAEAESGYNARLKIK